MSDVCVLDSMSHRHLSKASMVALRAASAYLAPLWSQGKRETQARPVVLVPLRTGIRKDC